MTGEGNICIIKSIVLRGGGLEGGEGSDGPPNITSGIPQLTTYFTVSTETPNMMVSYLMNFDGDGVIDYTGNSQMDCGRYCSIERNCV